MELAPIARKTAPKPEDEKPQPGKESSLETLRRHRIVRVRRQNEKLALDLKKTKGEMVPLAEIKREVLAANAVVKQQLLAIPFRLATTLATISDPRELGRVLSEALVEALNDLAYERNLYQPPGTCPCYGSRKEP